MKIVVLDFETFYDQDYSLSKISTEQYVRDLRFEVIGVSIKQGPEPAQWYSDPLEVHTALNAIDWNESALLAHNTYFDGPILGWRYGLYPKFYLDTMSMAKPRYNMTCGTSLAALAKQYELGEKGTDVVQAKGLRRPHFSTEQLSAYGQYCCNDTELTWRLFQRMREESQHEYKLIDQYIRLFVEPLLHLDGVLLGAHLDEVLAYKQVALTMAAYEVNMEPEELLVTVRSNQKFAKLLQDTFGIDPPKKFSPTTGKVTWALSKTDDEFIRLQETAEDDADTTLKTILDARIRNKTSIEETRTQALLGVASRGTLPVYLGHYQAHTGRAGGGDKLNLQNLPVRDTNFEFPIRQALVAPPDHVCVVPDLQQIEARMLAYLAGQEDVIEAFRRFDAGTGPDIYCVTASNIYGREITPVDVKERFVGKVVRLAMGYGMAWKQFQRVAKRGGTLLTQQESEQIVHRHRAVSKQIVNLWNQGDSALRCIIGHEVGALGKHGILRVTGEGICLPQWGRVIRYPHLRFHPRTADESAFFSYQNRKKQPRIYGAKVVENVTQALTGIIVAAAWLRLAARGLTVVLQVHDELVIVLHRDDVERWLPVIREEMVRVPEWAPGLPISCSIGYHERYGLAKG